MNRASTILETTVRPELRIAPPRNLDNDPILSKLREKQTDGILLRGVLLTSVIADGGMGTVYKGFHTRLDIPVAVKILKRRDQEDLHMLLREARLTARIGHPNLVRVYDVNVEPTTNLNYIVMEYIEGCSAYDLLQRRLNNQGRPLAQVAALEIVCSASKALGAAHERDIVHRDVKSENILIRSRDGEVKLTDLGLAGVYRSFSKSNGRHSSMSGTTGFIAPEVVVGKDVSPASDVYAMGVTLYELLTGKLPHNGEQDDTYYSRQLHSNPIDPREHVPGLNPDVVQILMRSLARNPAERFRDANALAAALEEPLRQMVGQRDSKAGEQDTNVPASRRPVVLCVDDEQGILDLEREILESQGFLPVCMTDPREAIRQLPSLAPDVALVDYNMPHMSGVELCYRMRQVNGYHSLGVLMLSGSGQSEIIDHALRNGITDFLTKPIDFDQLVTRVNLLAQLRIMSREKKFQR
jgi:serine/threonine protein kinase